MWGNMWTHNETRKADAHLHYAHIRSQKYLVTEGLFEETRELKERRHTGQEIGS